MRDESRRVSTLRDVRKRPFCPIGPGYRIWNPKRVLSQAQNPSEDDDKRGRSPNTTTPSLDAWLSSIATHVAIDLGKSNCQCVCTSRAGTAEKRHWVCFPHSGSGCRYGCRGVADADARQTQILPFRRRCKSKCQIFVQGPEQIFGAYRQMNFIARLKPLDIDS